MWNLYKCNCWLIIEVILRNARCNNKVQTSLFIILQVHHTCFGCQPQPSSGVHKTVNTASGTVQLPPSNVAKLAWPRWREVAAQYRRLYLQFCVLLMMVVVDTRNMYGELAE